MSPRRAGPKDRVAAAPTAAPAATDPADGSGSAPVPTPGRIVDPRAVRVALAPLSAHAGVAPVILEPPAVPLAPAPHATGTGILGGVALPSGGFRPGPVAGDGTVVVDGEPVPLRLERVGPVHAVLVEGGAAPSRTRVLLLPPDLSVAGASTGAAGRGQGVDRREVVVDGWRVEVEIESERRVSLRERARQGREETAHGGPTEVHAIIPGRVVSVSVVAGDPVVAGLQLLVVEAMKMQNELLAPRDGVISRVAVGVGHTVEAGDLLLVLE